MVFIVILSSRQHSKNKQNNRKLRLHSSAKTDQNLQQLRKSKKALTSVQKILLCFTMQKYS